MEVVVVRFRTSWSHSPPISGHFFRRHHLFIRKDHLCRKRAASPFKVERHISLSGDALNGAFAIHQIFPVGKSLHLDFNAFQIEVNYGIGIDKVTPDNNVIVTNGTHQPIYFVDIWQSMTVLRFPATALLVANALMLVMPFKAIAQICEVDNSIFDMPLLLFVALVGAAVGGLLARQRRGELERLNEQLRLINAALRRQAKIESYAPSLSYAPVGGRIQEKEVIVDPRKEELISHLKTGKNFLRNQDPDKAFVEFKTALKLSQDLSDPLEEKKAARGLGASLQRQGKFKEAIKYHSMVMTISKREGEDSGITEAYGAIADCYTELGDLEGAGKFYDKYIARLEAD